MSQNKKPLESGRDSSQRPSRPFDAIVIALSSALLVIFGIVIGRFIVTTQAVTVVDHFDGELASLQSEIVELNRKLVQSQARSTALEESAEQFRRLAQQHQIRAETLAARQQTVRSLLAGLTEQREACLDQVQQYVALDQPIPATDVLSFAQALFDMHATTMEHLAQNNSMSPSLPAVPSFPRVAAVTPAVPASAPHVTAPAFPSLPATNATMAGSRRANSTTSGVFFSPPRRQAPVATSTYFAPRRESQALSMPRKSGIQFHDTATRQETSARR